MGKLCRVLQDAARIVVDDSARAWKAESCTLPARPIRAGKSGDGNGGAGREGVVRQGEVDENQKQNHPERQRSGRDCVVYTRLR